MDLQRSLEGETIGIGKGIDLISIIDNVVNADVPRQGYSMYQVDRLHIIFSISSFLF